MLFISSLFCKPLSIVLAKISLIKSLQIVYVIKISRLSHMNNNVYLVSIHLFFFDIVLVLKIYMPAPMFYMLNEYIKLLPAVNTLLMYSLSSRTTSSKSVISLRPLTCHMPVMPGLIARRTLWCSS